VSTFSILVQPEDLSEVNVSRHWRGFIRTGKMAVMFRWWSQCCQGIKYKSNDLHHSWHQEPTRRKRSVNSRNKQQMQNIQLQAYIHIHNYDIQCSCLRLVIYTIWYHNSSLGARICDFKKSSTWVFLFHRDGQNMNETFIQRQWLTRQNHKVASYSWLQNSVQSLHRQHHKTKIQAEQIS